MRPIWRQNLQLGSKAKEHEGVVATINDRRDHPEGSFAAHSTAILGAANPRQMSKISRTVASWQFEAPCKEADTWIQGYVIVACIRNFGGCHSSTRHQRVELKLNGLTIDWFKLENIPPPHDDYFYRPPIPQIPKLKQIISCQTIYVWPVTSDKIIWGGQQTLVLDIDKKVRWDIDYLGLITETVPEPDFDIALSFAGEDRKYVEQVADILLEKGISVFYDVYEQANLWGEDLYEHLTDVYMERARYSVLFISTHYGQKLWAQLERKSAQARAFTESRGYILPARFDNTEIPGLLPTTGYVDINKMEPAVLVNLIIKKLSSRRDV